MDIEKEYKQIKTFFITLFTITGVLITIIAIFSYKDFASMREEYKDRLIQNEKRINDLYNYSEKIINRTETAGLREIKDIKSSVNNIARQEAINRINETFKYGSIELLVKKAAEKSINEEIDKIIENKIKKTEVKINEMTEASLTLMMNMQLMTDGDREGLKGIVKIIENEPFSTKGKLAKKILEIKSSDYREHFNKRLKNNLNKYLDYLKISKDIRENKNQLIISLFNIVQKNDQYLHEITVSVLALEKLLSLEIEVFDLNKIEEIRKKFETDLKY